MQDPEPLHVWPEPQTVPAASGAHTPSGWPVSAALQAWQELPVQAVLQQTPLEQFPLAHCEAEEQAPPCATAVEQTPELQTPLWQPVPVVQDDPIAPAQALPVHANPLAQALPQAPQFAGSAVVVSQNVPQSVPEPQVSVSPAAPILYSTSRFASAPVFEAQVEPVRRIDWRVAPAAKVISIGPVSDQ
jgi:hypothetical protein